jgi:uncharacterized protein
LTADVSAVVVTVLAVVAAYTVFGFVGFGAGMVALPFLVLVWPLKLVLAAMLMLDVVFSLVIGVRERRLAVWSEMRRLGPWVLVGLGLGWWVLSRAHETVLLSLLGGFVVVNALWNLLSTPKAAPISTLWAVPAGLVGAVFSALFGSGGPIYGLYLVRRIDDVSRLRATMGTLILVMTWLRLAVLQSAGLMSHQASTLWPLVTLMLPCAAVGFWMGSRLHARLDAVQVKRALWLVLLVAGFALLIKAAGP